MQCKVPLTSKCTHIWTIVHLKWNWFKSLRSWKAYENKSTSRWSKKDYTKYGIQCHMVFYVTMVVFGMTLLMNRWTNVVVDNGWVHPLAKTLPSLVNNLWWNIVTDDWNFDEKHIGKCWYLQHYKSIIPQFFLQGMTNSVGLTISVNDTTPWFTISIEQDNYTWWHYILYLV
jgi:hypothetical protein